MIVREGKTPVLEREEARRLFAPLEPAAAGGDVLALRDRALFALMLYGLVRVGAVARLSVRDFEDGGGDTSLTLHVPTVRTLALRMGLTVRGVRNALQALEEAGPQ